METGEYILGKKHGKIARGKISPLKFSLVVIILGFIL